MKVWKKNLIAVAVLATVCLGIYTNWVYTEDTKTVSLTDTLDSQKILSSDMLVMADDPMNEELMQSTVSDYFAAVRLSRREARDGAIALLQEAMSYSTDTDDVQVNQQLDSLVQVSLCESQIENLIIAKGYRDCVAYMSDEGVSIAVASPEGGLQAQDVAVIADIVMTQSGAEMEDIRVVEVQ